MVRYPARDLGVAPSLAECVPAVQLGAQREAVAQRRARCQEGGVQRDAYLGSRGHALAELVAHRDVQRRVQVAERHPRDQLTQPGLFLGPVVAPVAVPLIDHIVQLGVEPARDLRMAAERDRKSTRLNSSHSQISYAVFCLKKKKTQQLRITS